jgi:hypothetical protein
VPGDRCGSVNPTWSKARQAAFEGGPPELPGRPQPSSAPRGRRDEDAGNGVPRWMAAARAERSARGTESGLPSGSSAKRPRTEAGSISERRSGWRHRPAEEGGALVLGVDRRQRREAPPGRREPDQPTRAASKSLLIYPRASEQVAGRVPGKAAGRPDSGAIGASENAAGRRPGAAQPRYGGISTGSKPHLTCRFGYHASAVRRGSGTGVARSVQTRPWLTRRPWSGRAAGSRTSPGRWIGGLPDRNCRRWSGCWRRPAGGWRPRR